MTDMQACRLAEIVRTLAFRWVLFETFRNSASTGDGGNTLDNVGLSG
jgi:hypothetical protein